MRHLDPETGLTPHQQAAYRASVSAHVLPKFWAGEAFVHLMRSPTTLRLLGSVFSPQWLSERAAALVGESQSHSH